MVNKLKGTLIRAAVQGQAGFALVETLVALVILGTSVTAFIAGLSAGSIAVREQDNISSQQNLAQTQLEYTKSYAYIAGGVSYPPVTAPPGYSTSVNVSPITGTDTNIQKITVRVAREGAPTVTITGYKVNR